MKQPTEGYQQISVYYFPVSNKSQRIYHASDPEGAEEPARFVKFMLKAED